jgi:hypothetical protein
LLLLMLLLSRAVCRRGNLVAIILLLLLLLLWICLLLTLVAWLLGDPAVLGPGAPVGLCSKRMAGRRRSERVRGRRHVRSALGLSARTLARCRLCGIGAER